MRTEYYVRKLIVLSLLLVACSKTSAARERSYGVETPAPVPGASNWEVHFSPNGGCEDATVRHVNAARATIFVQAYSFTSKPITQALIRAHDRGVQVEVILDKSDVTAHGSELPDFQEGHVPVSIDSKHAIAHNKVMVFDSETVETGSFNFTKAAEHSNAENCLFVKDGQLAGTYLANWRLHRQHSD